MTTLFHTNKNIVRVFTSIFLLLTALFVSSPSAIAANINLGSVAMDVPAEMVIRMTPLASYLSKQTGLKVEFHASPDLESAVNELGNNTTQIAYFTPAAYMEAHTKYGAIPLVKPLNKGKGTFTLL